VKDEENYDGFEEQAKKIPEGKFKNNIIY